VTRSAVTRSGSAGVAGGPGRLAILVVNDDRRCLEANLMACRLLGIPRKAALSGTVDDFIAPGMRNRLDHVWRAFRDEGGYAGPFELNSEAAESAEVHISVTANVLPGRHLLVLWPTDARGRQTEAAPEAGQGAVAPIRGVTRGPRFGRAGPTSREREVLALLAAGATDEQIAEMLELSPATAQTHVRNAKAKLGARTRAQAVALALQQGMISLD
jgi:DNA-binding CsgD family transcriptional regulator